jgi:histidinol dehydrogenase
MPGLPSASLMWWIRWRQLQRAFARITNGSLPGDDRYTDEKGVELGHRWTAVEAAGLYVPGGLAAYPSSVLMNAIPGPCGRR